MQDRNQTPQDFASPDRPTGFASRIQADRPMARPVLTLADLPAPGRWQVRGVHGSEAHDQRLIELGFSRGTEVAFDRVAPLRDPVVFQLRGTRLCLRRRDARRIEIEPIPEPPSGATA
jgi:ferrous iron transport protein A